jgi:uncharacterized protein YjbJ (UPF0337 family)
MFQTKPTKQKEKEINMNSKTDKIKGAVNSTVGKGKQILGKATNDSEMETSGDLQRVKGSAQTASGEIKEKINDFGKAIKKAAH